jgi:transketolase
MNQESIQTQAIKTIKFLSVDGIQTAQSGHPGLPMGDAGIAYALWMKLLNFNPKNPDWFNRDRFILSGGHGSMLLYVMLHLTGYDVSMEELKSFRQWSGICKRCWDGSCRSTSGCRIQPTRAYNR